MADALTEIDLADLENAIEAGIRAGFPALQTVEFDREDHEGRKTPIISPACLLDCEEFESEGAEPDPGTGQLAAFARFSARLILGFRTAKVKREARKLATNLAAFMHLRRWSARVASVAVTHSGSGYTSPPTVAFSGGSGAGAMATAVLGTGPTAGTVIAVNVTNGGGSFESAPTVSFSGGGGSGAAATATVATIATGPGEVVGCYKDDFDPKLDQYTVWRVEWAHIVHLGQSAYEPDPDAVLPTTVLTRPSNPQGGDLDDPTVLVSP